MRGELRRILAEFGDAGNFLVTHDRVEAIALADQVAVMDAGRIAQIGSVHEVFTRQKNASLAKLVGVETGGPGRDRRIARRPGDGPQWAPHDCWPSNLGSHLRTSTSASKEKTSHCRRVTSGSSSVRNHLACNGSRDHSGRIVSPSDPGLRFRTDISDHEASV